MQKIFGVCLILCFVLLGCSAKVVDVNVDNPPAGLSLITSTLPVGNPQDKFCREAGGVSQIGIVQAGRVWLCVFPDGSECLAEQISTQKCKMGDNPLKEVQIFLGNSVKNPNAADCALVYPVTRKIGALRWTERETILQLLAGITTKEKVEKYYTALNVGVGLKNLRITDGLAHVDFDEQLEKEVGGSCRVTAIRAQITETLKQFPNIKEVEIAVNGRTEDILQP